MLSPVTGCLAGWWAAERDPRMHMIADLSSEKLSLHRSQCTILLYGLSCFSAISEASLLYTTVAVVPMPPDVENTSGENDPCSISLICSSYVLLFSISLQR